MRLFMEELPNNKSQKFCFYKIIIKMKKTQPVLIKQIRKSQNHFFCLKYKNTWADVYMNDNLKIQTDIKSIISK